MGETEVLHRWFIDGEGTWCVQIGNKLGRKNHYYLSSDSVRRMACKLEIAEAGGQQDEWHQDKGGAWCTQIGPDSLAQEWGWYHFLTADSVRQLAAELEIVRGARTSELDSSAHFGFGPTEYVLSPAQKLKRWVLGRKETRRREVERCSRPSQKAAS